MAKNEEKMELKSGRSQWNFLGRAKVNGDYTYTIEQAAAHSDWVSNKLNLGIDCGSGNVVYTEMFGGYGVERENKVFVFGKKYDEEKQKDVDDYTNKYTIAWEDRFNEDILSEIGYGRFIRIGLEKIEDKFNELKSLLIKLKENGKASMEEVEIDLIKSLTKELKPYYESIDLNTKFNKNHKDRTITKLFLSEYDAILYIKEHLKDGMIVNTKGGFKFERNDMSGAIYVKKAIKSMFLNNVEEDHFKATFSQTILVDKDSIGNLDKEKNTYEINARVLSWTKMYNKEEVRQVVPMPVTFEFPMINTPEQTKKVMNYMFKCKKGVSEVIVEGNVIEGAEVVAITEDDLPDDVKFFFQNEVFNEKQAKNASAIKTDREKRLIIKNPAMKRHYDKEGNVTNVTMELEEDKYTEDDLFFDFMSNNEDEESTVELTKEVKVAVDEAELPDVTSEDDFANILANL